MSKGEQMRNGFVPMAETVSYAIFDPFGHNFAGISANPPSLLKESAGYALRGSNVRSYRPDAEGLSQEEEEMLDKRRVTAWSYALLRRKQYFGNARNSRKIFDAYYEDEEWGKEIKKELNYYAAFKEAWARAKKFENTPVPAFDSKEIAELKGGLSNTSEATRKKLDDGIRGYLGQVLSGDRWDRRSWTMFAISFLNDVNNLADFVSSDYYFSWSQPHYSLAAQVAARMLLPREEGERIIEIVNSIFDEVFANILIIEAAFEQAIAPIPPVFALTAEDRKIVENPIPIVFASTLPLDRESPPKATRWEWKNPDKKESEILLPATEIGALGADVIFARSTDETALRKILEDRGIEVEVVIDDEIFEGVEGGEGFEQAPTVWK